MTKKIPYIYAIGRRKSARARVRLFSGKGESTVNGMVIEKYFPGEIAKEKYLLPFRVTETEDKYYISVKVTGGGKESQLDAMVVGIARTLVKVKEEKYKPLLKKLKLLTSDSRIRERRKVGTGGKARRKKQSPKR